jgi:uncharacterized protein YceH (UPF0502 family)
LPDGADGTKLYDWAKFIAAETEEELNMLAERNPEVGRAVIKLKKMSADEKARDLYERRLKAMRDHAMHVDEAERKEREKWQDVVAEKDTALAEKDAQIAELQAKLKGLS